MIQTKLRNRSDSEIRNAIATVVMAAAAATARMVFSTVLPKLAADWLLSCHRQARKPKMQGSIHRTNSSSSSSRVVHQAMMHPSVTKCSLEGRGSQTLVCDFQTSLLRPQQQQQSLFPYFMLVAFEGGSLLRALVLLMSYPFLFVLGLNEEISLKIMVFISFCGMRKRVVQIVSTTVLPKFYLENLNLHSYEVLASTRRRVVVTRVPRVMVERFLKEYLGVDEVLGAELHVFGGCFFSGLISNGGSLGERNKVLKDLFGEKKADVGLVGYCSPQDSLFIPYCKEPYVVTREASGPSSVMPRDKYPKPLIFHDGRLAFLPTPSASLVLFLYFPFGLMLAIVRILLGNALPYKLSLVVGAITGFKLRVHNLPTRQTSNSNSNGANNKHNGVLYVCNHKTLLDPVMLTGALARSLSAVTYSLSPVSELISPIRTVRLMRDRIADAAKIQQLLKAGDLVVCPEGTTCREPYLLRFSALFAELADEMVPVALETRVSMFYGTTASGFKWLDPVYFMMNPRPEYELRFLGLVPKEFTCAGGLKAMDVANRIQRQLGEELGFECTGLTRKDKYLMLSGNEGIVK